MSVLAGVAGVKSAEAIQLDQLDVESVDGRVNAAPDRRRHSGERSGTYGVPHSPLSVARRKPRMLASLGDTHTSKQTRTRHSIPPRLTFVV